MTGFTPKEAFNRLARAFFSVVPQGYSTYCSLNSRICIDVLDRLGVKASLLPCQLWHASPSGNHVVGFVGSSKKTINKWDGHVICAADDYLIDTAISHLKKEFDLEVPAVVTGPRFPLRSNALSRFDLSPYERIWWIVPPKDIDTTPPDESPELVKHYAKLLHRHILSNRADAFGDAT